MLRVINKKHANQAPTMRTESCLYIDSALTVLATQF